MYRFLFLAALIGFAACRQRGYNNGSKGTEFHRAGTGSGALIAAESREYVNGAGQKLVFIDMVHIGPQEYYSAIGANIAKKFREDSNMAVIVEGVRCASTARALLSTENLQTDAKALPGYSASSLEEARAAFANATAQDLQRAGNSRTYELVSCQAQSSSGSLNDTYGQIAAQFGLATQSQQKLYPPGVKLVQQDLDVSSLSPGEMMAFGPWFSCMSNKTCIASPNSPVTWVNQGGTPQAQAAKAIIDEIILNKRNEITMNNVRAELAKGITTVVVPWGEKHMAGLYKLAESIGFRRKESLDIAVASCTRASENMLLGQLFGEICSNRGLDNLYQELDILNSLLQAYELLNDQANAAEIKRQIAEIKQKIASLESHAPGGQTGGETNTGNNNPGPSNNCAQIKITGGSEGKFWVYKLSAQNKLEPVGSLKPNSVHNVIKSADPYYIIDGSMFNETEVYAYKNWVQCTNWHT